MEYESINNNLFRREQCLSSVTLNLRLLMDPEITIIFLNLILCVVRRTIASK